MIAEQSGTSVKWKHQNTITGSYQKVSEDGYKVVSYNPPGSAEFEPFNGIVPQQDPSIEQSELGGALTPDNYKFGGNVHRPEFGCEIDGSPTPCNILFLALGAFKFTNGFQIRLQGDEVIGFPVSFLSSILEERTEQEGFQLCDSIDGNCGNNTPFQPQTFYVQNETFSHLTAAMSLNPSKLIEGPDYAQLANSVNQCAKDMFRVELIRGTGEWSGTYDEKGKPIEGKMNFRPLDGMVIEDHTNSTGSRKNGTYGPAHASSFTVYNNWTSYSAKQLGGRAGLAINSVYGRGIYSTVFPLKINIWPPSVSLTRTTSNVTWTANDRPYGTHGDFIASGTGIPKIILTQIHETGNALATITGQKYTPPKVLYDVYPDGKPYYLESDLDSGQAFEICVIRKYRRLTNQVIR